MYCGAVIVSPSEGAKEILTLQRSSTVGLAQHRGLNLAQSFEVRASQPLLLPLSGGGCQYTVMFVDR